LQPRAGGHDQDVVAQCGPVPEVDPVVLHVDVVDPGLAVADAGAKLRPARAGYPPHVGPAERDEQQPGLVNVVTVAVRHDNLDGLRPVGSPQPVRDQRPAGAATEDDDPFHAANLVPGRIATSEALVPRPGDDPPGPVAAPCAATASAADSQYAVPPGPITRLPADPAVIRAVTEVAIAITYSRQPAPLHVQAGSSPDGQVGALATLTCDVRLWPGSLPAARCDARRWQRCSPLRTRSASTARSTGIFPGGCGW
jgi:hypothetical protein